MGLAGNMVVSGKAWVSSNSHRMTRASCVHTSRPSDGPGRSTWSLEAGDLEPTQQGPVLSALSLRRVLWASPSLKYELLLFQVTRELNCCESSGVSLLSVMQSLVLVYPSPGDPGREDVTVIPQPAP